VAYKPQAVTTCRQARIVYYSRPIDMQTFVIALLTVAFFGLAIVIGLAHRDMTRAADHIQGAVNRMDRAATACERVADACVRLADAVVQLVRDRRGDQPAE
jgi:hypothetical protein